ncbi:MAG TPA: fluoride efflux transporter CrcB [Firmicutes bacterium]|nr:fluoride efflux transporter CrcB [Bacillota bacterium]
MYKLLAVALGGLLGASARYLVSGWAQKAWGSSFPWGTALVNIVGCFLIGYLMTYSIEVSPMRVELRLFLVPGILGGLTTFSAFGYETMRFVQDGTPLLALANLGLNLIGGLGAVMLGTWVARSL